MSVLNRLDRKEKVTDSIDTTDGVIYIVGDKIVYWDYQDRVQLVGKTNLYVRYVKKDALEKIFKTKDLTSVFEAGQVKQRHDGRLLRVFRFEDNVYVTTQKKIVAVCTNNKDFVFRDEKKQFPLTSLDLTLIKKDICYLIVLTLNDKLLLSQKFSFSKLKMGKIGKMTALEIDKGDMPQVQTVSTYYDLTTLFKSCICIKDDVVYQLD